MVVTDGDARDRIRRLGHVEHLRRPPNGSSVRARRASSARGDSCKATSFISGERPVSKAARGRARTRGHARTCSRARMEAGLSSMATTKMLGSPSLGIGRQCLMITSVELLRRSM
jgi:hypothetical protein